MTTSKYSPEELRKMARHAIAQRDIGSPRYEAFLLMLMMRLGTFDRATVEAKIKELAQ